MVETSDKSAKLKELGNSFFKKSDFPRAINAYKESLAHAQNEPVKVILLSNTA